MSTSDILMLAAIVVFLVAAFLTYGRTRTLDLISIGLALLTTALFLVY